MRLQTVIKACVLQVPPIDPAKPNEQIERNEYTLKNVRNGNERNPSAPLYNIVFLSPQFQDFPITHILREIKVGDI